MIRPYDESTDTFPRGPDLPTLDVSLRGPLPIPETEGSQG